MQQELFLGLTGTAWSAISSIATALAVVVALFIPFYYENKRKKNIVNVLECELFDNYKLLKKAQQSTDGIFHGEVIPKIQYKCLILNTITLDCWKDNKKTIAELSEKSYIKYSEVNTFLDELKKQSLEISNNKMNSSYGAVIEKTIDIVIIKIEKILKKRMLTIASTLTTRPDTQSASLNL